MDVRYFLVLLYFHNTLFSELVQVVTGLLMAEVNVKTMCELGSGGVSLVISWICFDVYVCLFLW